MQDKIKISAVSYFNTLPFIYGIEKCKTLKNKIILSKDIPSVCSKKLINNEVDIGLIPVAEIRNLETPEIISEFCIGAVGKVNSVIILSEVPLIEVKKIYLDYQSKTSVNLVKILAENFWKRDIAYIDAEPGYEKEITGTVAGLIIGDRAFQYKDNYKYVMDLSEEWMKFTNLPFVFAAWVANKEIPDDFVKEFNIALKTGINNLDKVASSYHTETKHLNFDLKKYLEEDISFILDSDKKKAMELFTQMLNRR